MRELNDSTFFPPGNGIRAQGSLHAACMSRTWTVLGTTLNARSVTMESAYDCVHVCIHMWIHMCSVRTLGQGMCAGMNIAAKLHSSLMEFVWFYSWRHGLATLPRLASNF